MSQETKICKVCGEELPIEKFSLNKPSHCEPYRLGTCNKCRYMQKIARLIKLSDRIEIILDRRYKDIKQERILDKSLIPHIDLVGDDEYFVRLMEYKDLWISNYGRAIHLYQNGEYRLLKAKDHYGLCYRVRKEVYVDGRYKYVNKELYAAQAVVETFIINHDKRNANFIWHKGNDKNDNYYKHLYPLTRKQIKVVRHHFKQTGDDSEEYILKVMNDLKFKPDDWSKSCMKPTISGVGYWGRDGVDVNSKAYRRWIDMIHRCYNDKLHERAPRYKECTVCEEWLNFSNFEVWYNKHKPEGLDVDLDKDIMFEGNKIYDPEHVVFVPHIIHTILNGTQDKHGQYPVGVWRRRNEYRASVNVMGRNIKLGQFDTPEEAFERYKVYKEDLIKDVAELYKNDIPDRVYKIMLTWEINNTD